MKILRGAEAEKRHKEIKKGESKEGSGYYFLDGVYRTFKIENCQLKEKDFNNKLDSHDWIYGRLEE